MIFVAGLKKKKTLGTYHISPVYQQQMACELVVVIMNN